MSLLSLIMVMEHISIERRQNMVRALREAGVSFDEIVTILRVGSQCAEQVGSRKNLVPNTDNAGEQHETRIR